MKHRLNVNETKQSVNKIQQNTTDDLYVRFKIFFENQRNPEKYSCLYNIFKLNSTMLHINKVILYKYLPE